jgi:hypothetical protein
MDVASDSAPRAQVAPLVLQMLNGFLMAQALHVAAALRIPDLLAKGPRHVDDLAEQTATHGPSLLRLLRVLAAAGVVREQEEGFALDALGDVLRSDVQGSVRDWALFVGEPEMWAVWGGLRESIRTGEPAFPRVHGMPMWDYLAERPTLGEPFHNWMLRQSEQHNAAFVASYDFSPFRVVADIGGGRGSTLAAILRACPSLRGILLDLPSVVANVAPLQQAGVEPRCEVTGGDMLKAVPPGADVYLVKRVLMDWGDEQAGTILRNCADALPDNGRVLVIEMVLPPGNEPHPGRLFDLVMLMNHRGGRIRTESEFRSLFAAAGLKVSRVIPTPSPNSIIEGVRT